MEPWHVLSSTVVIDNWPYSRTRLDRCRLPNGQEIDYYVQEYPEWVNAVVLTPDEQVVLVRQYRHGRGETVLETPGGMVDPGEDPEAAIVREVAEETGYRSDAAPELLGRMLVNPAVSNNTVRTYRLLGAVPVEASHPDSTENLETVVMPLAEAIEMVVTGRLPHIFSAVGLLLASRPEHRRFP